MKRAGLYGGPQTSVDEASQRTRRESVTGRAKQAEEAVGKGGDAAAALGAPPGTRRESRFSPDPAAPTDRYRLVTPFSLRF